MKMFHVPPLSTIRGFRAGQLNEFRARPSHVIYVNIITIHSAKETRPEKYEKIYILYIYAKIPKFGVSKTV